MSTTGHYFGVSIQEFIDAVQSLGGRFEISVSNSLVLVWPNPEDHARSPLAAEVDFEGDRAWLESGCTPNFNGQFEMAAILEGRGIKAGYWE